MQRVTRNTIPTFRRLAQLTEERGNGTDVFKKYGQSRKNSGLFFKKYMLILCSEIKHKGLLVH